MASASWRPAWLSVRLELLVAVFAKPGKPRYCQLSDFVRLAELDIVDVGGVTRFIDEDHRGGSDMTAHAADALIPNHDVQKGAVVWIGGALSSRVWRQSMK